MAYSYTEKKRIRKNFGKQASVLDVPFLLATQINSYKEFLQEEADPDKRADQGLHAAFKSVFPIVSYSGNAALEFVSYRLGTPTFDTKECLMRGVTYAANLGRDADTIGTMCGAIAGALGGVEAIRADWVEKAKTLASTDQEALALSLSQVAVAKYQRETAARAAFAQIAS